MSVLVFDSDPVAVERSEVLARLPALHLMAASPPKSEQLRPLFSETELAKVESGQRRNRGMIMRSGLFVVPALAGLLSACATVSSRPDDAAPKLSAKAAGVTYFLPKKLVKLTATKTAVDIDKLKKDVTSKTTALNTAVATQTAAKAAADQALAVFTAMDAAAAGRPAQQILVDQTKGAQTVADADVIKKTGELQTSTVAWLAALANGQACTFDAKLELQPAQADPAYRFTAVLRHNWVRDDTVKLAVNPAGLLSSANVTAIDHTGDIIVEAAGAIAALGGVPVPGVHTATATPAAPACDAEPKQIVQFFDPTVTADVTTASNALKLAGYPFKIAIDGAPNPAPDSKADTAVASELFRRYRGTLFYRSPLPLTISLKKNEKIDDSGRWHVVDGAIVMIPQAGPISYIPTNAGAFVKTVDDVTFVDGTIASWNPNRPSELLEVVRLPVKVLTAIVSVPAQLLSLRVDYDSKAKALADAQVAQLTSQQALQKLKDCVTAATAAGTDVNACFVPPK